ncbi:2-keto-4-pentenoate hydratase [Acidisoma sp. 7E03]
MSLSDQLLTARSSGRMLSPSEIPAVSSAAEAYAVQQAVTRALGPIGGWKVGAAGSEAPPSGAALPRSGILPSGTTLGADFTDRLVESEIAFLIGRDLAPRDTPYSRTEVVAAIASCHPVIEVVQWRIPGWESASPMLKLADSIGHGALILGEAIADWQSIDFATLTVAQEITGAPVKHATGNPAGDMIRLIAWLADEGAVWSGGLRAGQIVTCGSWTGALPAPAGGTATTHFAGTQPVRVSFSAA